MDDIIKLKARDYLKKLCSKEFHDKLIRHIEAFTLGGELITKEQYIVMLPLSISNINSLKKICFLQI